MSKHTPDSQSKQQLTLFYTDAFVAWLTAGWLRDDDPVRSVRNGDDDVPWSDDAPTLDDGDDDYPFATPWYLRREVK